jgi:hypothetical protein
MSDLLLMLSRIVVGWSGSLSQQQDMRSISYGCCRSVSGVGQDFSYSPATLFLIVSTASPTAFIALVRGS